MLNYLIVDDEPLIRKGIIKLISRVAPEWKACGEAWNGAEGLEMAERLRPDLIFSDIRMPEMDGLSMAALLIERGFAVPIVFFTGHDEFAYIQQALKNNAFDYLLKPIKENDVRQLFSRYEREHVVNQAVEKKDMTLIKQYEFYLQNALESENLKLLEELEGWYDRLRASLPLRSFVELTIRTVNSYLLRRDVIGAEYRPVINATNASNVIRMLQAHCIAQVEETRESSTNRIIEKVRRWVNERIQDNPSLSDAAELVHLNVTYFSEYFKKNAGETFSQYVTRAKIQRAKTLLADPSLRVYDVAEKVGYSDHRHFSKVFQSIVGTTPSEFRNKATGSE